MPFCDLLFEPPFIAHRGARSRAPENTLAAFAAAREDGATWIECDIKLTSDGVPILMHDDTLDRTTNGTGAVADMNWAEMQLLDAGGWVGPAFKGTRIPSLADLLVFARATGMRLNLELKPCPGRTQATVMVTMIEMMKLWPDMPQPPLISSFDIEALTIASQLHPDWPRGLLIEEWRDDWQEVMALTGASTLNIDDDLLTPDRLDALRRTGVPLLVFTVNDPARAQELLRSGVRAIYCDNPAEMLQHFQKRLSQQ